MRTPGTPESFLRYPTSTLLATPASVRVLRELMESDVPMAVSAVAERTGLTTQSVRNAVAALGRGGIVQQLGEGRARLYRPDVAHPLYLPLGALFHAETERFATVIDALRAGVENLVPAPLGAWIYGSVARGDDAPDADVEVAFVSADDDAETPASRLREVLEPIQEVQRVWITVIGLAPSEVRRLARGDRWWKRATKPHVAIFGQGPHEIAEELARPTRTRGRFRE